MSIRLTLTSLAVLSHIDNTFILTSFFLGFKTECLRYAAQIGFSFMLLIPVLDILISLAHAPAF